MTSQISAVIPHVAIRENRVVTDSISVAEFFEKRHDDVVRKIRAVMLDCEPSYRLRNFTETSYQRDNPNGGPGISTPMIELTRDAFVLIAMGFTGKKALQWKIRYIEAFNEMESELLRRSVPPAPTYPPFSGDHANRTELIYYHDFKPIFCRVLRPEETVLTPESMKEWMEMRGIIFFTLEELKNLTVYQLMAIAHQ
ncbi:Rha family transcriptional regulator [Citrobacter meridianamericanus]|uniref:Rha family transcriptional regulator n=1 Tax=Citrobacter meridianamericanus TaxID=2894201 RepID=A0ABT1B6X8_9ENTR|nr:Rha family transcriptional regulator [Citrobacter meridianamericanus]MCO5781590.1 Rha family transcriptional regulator [Citrobacter meridianamericanus]